MLYQVPKIVVAWESRTAIPAGRPHHAPSSCCLETWGEGRGLQESLDAQGEQHNWKQVEGWSVDSWVFWRMLILRLVDQGRLLGGRRAKVFDDGI